MTRPALYVLINVLLAIATMAGFMIHKNVAHPIFVIALFAICSTPLIEAKAINGRYALLALWSGYYFIMYGALDLRNLLLGVDGEMIPPEGILDAGEVVIVVAAGIFQLAYRAALRFSSRDPAKPIMNWSETSLIVVGVVLWVVATRLAWEFSVNLMATKTNEGTAAGLAAIGGARVMMFMMARMTQPLSILMIIYAQCRYRRAYMLPVVLAVVLFQVFYGFVIDTKAEALTGGILVVLTNVLVTGRVPKLWAALMLLIVVVAFPILQANRVVRDEHNLDSTKASQNLAMVLEEALNAKDRVNTGKERAQTALERVTTKSSVELIVRGVGTTHAYMGGYTLTPMFSAFIPRVIWSDKPSVPTGQIMNKEFHVSAAAETYISPSHLGELYWNFGWFGVLGGVTLIGLLLGTLGAKFDLSEAATITRLLVLVVTVRQIILGSEGEIATQYVVWMRSMAGIGLMHWVFARVPWTSDRTREVVSASGGSERPQASPLPFPNLLR